MSISQLLDEHNGIPNLPLVIKTDEILRDKKDLSFRMSRQCLPATFSCFCP
jgi:hypothetical protein